MHSIECQASSYITTCLSRSYTVQPKCTTFIFMIQTIIILSQVCRKRRALIHRLCPLQTICFDGVSSFYQISRPTSTPAIGRPTGATAPKTTFLPQQIYLTNFVDLICDYNAPPEAQNVTNTALRV